MDTGEQGATRPSPAFETAIRSVTGNHRRSNQDSAGCTDAVVVVADGVGGHVGGDVASWTVVRHVLAGLGDLDDVRTRSITDLQAHVAAANAELRGRVERDPSLAGMGTTFTAVVCGEATVRLVHVGDSRAYLLRDGTGRRVSRDHSLVQLLVDSGEIAPSEAFDHPNRNVILRSLTGSPEDPAGLQLREIEARPGDRWLLASDGLTDHVTEERCLELLAGAATPQEAADALLAAAADADARDNVTVAVADLVEVAPDAPGEGRGAVVLEGAAAQDGLGDLGDMAG
ncbi:serine/threonine protein phosphatase [Actinotalea ferrariae CF5-4]|uniref:Serine/threonine protein phosphatase n=1 Tax=Actinotalea ferrariae CF5-4 TaxID=948458 RepID=A0A021VQ23_9CELL|nr:protein phosphatase 2C domain-containing protein [Actinotalea ferrariae]EYR62140.1 serine/threonine protein phosphatase [Actinotalea ferrariae CF5-4]